MERFKKFAAPALAALLAIVLTFILKSVPTAKLWKGYTTLSVPAESAADDVDDVLRSQNCGVFIALEFQDARFPEPYRTARLKYFYDKTGEARVYYIPDSAAANAASAARILQSAFHIDAAVGSRAVFPHFSALVCLFVFLAFLYFAENKAVFSAASFPALFFCFCNPYCAAAAGVCLELYALFLAQKAWRRRGALFAAAKNPFALLFMASSLLLSAAAGGLRPFLFVLNLFAALCLVFLFYNVESLFQKNARFLPVFIRSAARMNLSGAGSVRKAAFSSAGIFVLFVFFLSESAFAPASGKGRLFFPAPTEYNGSASDFPTMDDYYAVRWNEAAAPYRSLNKAYPERPSDGDRVLMTHYEKGPDGIKSAEAAVLSYDKAFRKEASDALERLERAPIEKLWKAQGRAFSVRYASSAGEGPFVAAALLFAMLPPLFAGLYYIFALKRGRYVS